eukprot:TRINITY_DN23887_c0_g1_i1.p1 TRINITY_DN23887_c0_g1~~TRINITY_DN23887_c0_g1_i1.p1  ORF type:complete len:216 (-),score=30.62 TRINITY_DN23887_c0_g1_i1:249-896(-)
MAYGFSHIQMMHYYPMRAMRENDHAALAVAATQQDLGVTGRAVAYAELRASMDSNPGPFSEPRTTERRLRRSREPLDAAEVASAHAEGKHCSVRKHLRLGCAVVNFESRDMQEAVLEYLSSLQEGEGLPHCRLGSHVVSVQEHFDKVSNAYDKKSIFVAWGHQVEKQTPIPTYLIVDTFDAIGKQCLQFSRETTPPDADLVPVPIFDESNTTFLL